MPDALELKHLHERMYKIKEAGDRVTELKKYIEWLNRPQGSPVWEGLCQIHDEVTRKAITAFAKKSVEEELMVAEDKLLKL